MEKKLKLSLLEVFPGTLTVALTLTPLSSRVRKREKPAAVSSTAMRLPELQPDSGQRLRAPLSLYD